MKLNQKDEDTLRGIETQSPNLVQGSIDYLVSLGLVWTAWSNFGYKLSDEGTNYLDNLE